VVSKGGSRISEVIREEDRGVTAGREVEDERDASGITETMSFTGEPASRTAKGLFASPPFAPAAWWFGAAIVNWRQDVPQLRTECSTVRVSIAAVSSESTLTHHRLPATLGDRYRQSDHRR
jgi:hypothetical protein